MNTLLFAAVTAAATNLTSELPPVVVEASRIGQTKAEIAAHVDVLTRADIESSGAVSTVDLLEKRANLFLRKLNGNPALTQVSLRGYGANSFGRVKVIVDGEEINNPDMASQDFLRIPVRAIECVEILHGPQTVLHGSEASAGVINIITDSNSYERKSAIEVHGGNYGQVGVYAGTRGGFEDLGLTYFADFSYDRADGWRSNSGYDAWTVKGGLRQNFDNGSHLGVKAFYAHTRYGLPGSLYSDGYDWSGVYHRSWKADPEASDSPHDHAENNVYGVTFDGEAVLNEENSLTGSFTFRNRQAKSFYRSYSTENIADIYGLTAKLLYSNTSEVFGLANRFDLGTDHKIDLLYVESSARNAYSRYSGALFLRDELFVLNDLSIFCGVRGESFSTKDTYKSTYGSSADHATKSAVAGEIGLNWRPVEDLKIFAKWSRFYHAPLADELFSYYGAPNMGLKPEAGHNTEVGLDWTFCPDFNFNMTGFHTELDDEIMYVNYANQNAPDHTARSGLEASLTWSRDRVGSAGILYRYVYARFTEGDYKGNSIPMVPEHLTRVFGEIFLTDWIAINGGFRYVSEQHLDSDFGSVASAMPGYGIFDVGLRVMPTWRWLDGFTFSLTVDNLFDKRYADYGIYSGGGANAYYPALGRSFLFTIRYEF